MAGCNVEELLDKFDTLNETLATLAARFVTPEEKSIAEVVEDLELSCGDTEVNFDTASLVTALEGVGDDIEAQTTMQETRSIAEVTAQNTNFDDLATAVEGIEFNCAPDVNLSCSPDVTVISGGAGGETGTVLPHDPGTIGEDPPDGYDPYDPEIVDETTCKIANAIVDELINILQAFIDGGVLWTIQVGGYITAAGLLIATIFMTPVNIIFGITAPKIVGFLASLFTQLNQLENSDLTELINILTENEEEFVCILYNGQEGDSVLDVKAAFDQALLDHEANVAQRALMDAFLAVDVLNNLYWQPTWALNGKTVEEWLDGYEGSVDCEMCDPCPLFTVTFGTIIEETSNYITCDSEDVYGSTYVEVYIHQNYPTSPCGPKRLISATVNISSSRNDFWRIWDENGNLVAQGNSSNMPNGICGQAITITPSNTQDFRATITVGNEC
jgi:hypothetical protein